MTRNDIIEAARKAGFETKRDMTWVDKWEVTRTLTRFAALVAAAEREACAKECDAVAQKMDDEGEGPTGYIAWVTDCAASIRARGKA